MKPTSRGQRSRTDTLVRKLFFLCGAVTLILTIALTALFVVGGIWGIAGIGMNAFLTGLPGTGFTGFLPLLVSAIYAAGGAVLISAPLGILTAVFFQYAPVKRFARFMTRFFQFMASLPGIVYAIVAIGTLMPFLEARLGVVQGKSLLTAILLLAAMMLPEIILGSLQVVGHGQKDVELAALCLGAGHIEAVFRAGLTGARYDLCCVVLQAVGRAAGQTLAVIAVAGAVANWPSLLAPDELMSGGVFFAMENGDLCLALGLALMLFLLYFCLQAVLRGMRRNRSLKSLNQKPEDNLL